MSLHEIYVGNIGKVLESTNPVEAHRIYLEYRRKSIEGEGLGANEPVVWFKDGMIYQEFQPKKRN